MTKERLIIFGLLAALFIFSLALHLYRISYPAQPVFDEAHFATYAADYANGKAFFDIHPPLGKLMYAAVLSFFEPQTYKNAKFINVFKDSAGGVKLIAEVAPGGYGDFPYIPLRILSAFFGAMLPLSLYGFMRSISASRIAAFSAALFVALENSLLLETRLILLNGMYLVFGFAALALYFKKSPWPFAAGAVWGLSLGVKLIGIVFVGATIIGLALGRPAKQFARFIIMGLAVYAIITLGNNLFFSVSERVSVWKSLGFSANISSLPAAPLVASALETILSVGGYVIGDSSPHPKFSSPWYLWPLMLKPIDYYAGITLIGNPVIWFLSLLAIILGIFKIWSIFRKSSMARAGETRALSILIGGYLFSLMPFIFVERSTYLYHYFPALLFAICALAWIFWDLLESGPIFLKKHRILWCAVLFAAAAAGFAAIAHLTYAL